MYPARSSTTSMITIIMPQDSSKGKRSWVRAKRAREVLLVLERGPWGERCCSYDGDIPYVVAFYDMRPFNTAIGRNDKAPVTPTALSLSLSLQSSPPGRTLGKGRKEAGGIWSLVRTPTSGVPSP